MKVQNNTKSPLFLIIIFILNLLNFETNCQTTTTTPIIIYNDLFSNLSTSFQTINTVNSSVTNSDLKQTQCICNLNPGICDYNCCCDLDCPVSLLTSWLLNNNNICLDKQANTQNEFTACFDSNILVYFNLKRGMRSYLQGDQFCVTFDNSSKSAQFYNSIGVLNSTEIESLFNQMDQSKTVFNINYVYDNRTDLINPLIGNYNVDDFIYSVKNITDSIQLTSKFTTFSRGLTGECVRSNKVKWMRDIVDEIPCQFKLV